MIGKARNRTTLFDFDSLSLVGRSVLCERARVCVCVKPVEVLKPTQPSVPPGSVNEYQIRLERQRQVLVHSVIADVRGVCR